MYEIIKRDSGVNRRNLVNRIDKDINIKEAIMYRDNMNKRVSCDEYNTPVNCIQSLLNNISIHEMTILEPSAGDGNIVKILRLNDIKANITAIELRHTENDKLREVADNVYIGNFLTLETNKKYDLIIGNPPFSKALEFIEKCFHLLSDNGRMIMLLRTAFLESKQRYDFWLRHPLSSLYVLSTRPSFTGKGTDSTSYSWFCWDKCSTKQEIKVIK